MSNDKATTNINKLKHFFTVAGLGSTIIAAILLSLFYRHMAISDIVTLGERSNRALAETVFNSVKNELKDYLISTKKTAGTPHAQHRLLPPKLDKAIQDIMANASVIRIKIYNKDGIVIFSTKPNQIGIDQSTNIQFQSALGGQVTSKLIFKDRFSLFSKHSEEDNLLQSYIPVRLSATSPIYGVFEIYSDVKLIVHHVEHTETIVFFGVFLILLLLYSFLVFIVRFSAKTIEQQQSIIQERTKTLKLLSAQMLNVQETEKKKIAHKLHEGIAQNLAAIKNNIETIATKQTDYHTGDDAQPLQQAIHTIQETIQEVRALTMILRPPSLDDFGLIKTLHCLCNECRDVYPDISIKTSFELDESSLPGTVKTLIYRITQEALESITIAGTADVVQLNLTGNKNIVSFSLQDNALTPHANETQSSQSVSTAFAAMKERTLLSGGTFSINSIPHGGTLAKSTWEY